MNRTLQFVGNIRQTAKYSRTASYLNRSDRVLTRTNAVDEVLHGLGFVGENGTLVVDRGGWEVIPEKVNGKARMEAVPLKKQYGEGGLNLHGCFLC